MTEGVQEWLSEMKEADVLIGIPGYSDGNTIGHVVMADRAGLARYFSDRKAVPVNSDGGCIDGTIDTVQKTAIEDCRSVFLTRQKSLLKITAPYHGIPGKGSAFRTLLEFVCSLNVRACAVVDADLRSTTPEWIDALLRPALEMGYDRVAPYYLETRESSASEVEEKTENLCLRFENQKNMLIEGWQV